jgi:hypothetical protein
LDATFIDWARLTQGPGLLAKAVHEPTNPPKRVTIDVIGAR